MSRAVWFLNLKIELIQCLVSDYDYILIVVHLSALHGRYIIQSVTQSRNYNRFETATVHYTAMLE